MKKTSFGYIKTIQTKEIKEINFFSFSKAGRPHKHTREEVVFITSGSGIIHRENQTIPVQKGSLITIESNKSHYMVPDEGECLELILWYE